MVPDDFAVSLFSLSYHRHRYEYIIYWFLMIFYFRWSRMDALFSGKEYIIINIDVGLRPLK